MLLDKDIEKVFYSQEQIENKIKEIAEQINNEYKGKEIILVGILKGSFAFMSKLIEYIDLYCNIDFIVCSSYVGTQSTGLIHIDSDMKIDANGKDVILVEDIIDTGLTVKAIKDVVCKRGAKSVKIASLLYKPCNNKYNVIPDWYAFEIGNEFVVGFGLDYNQLYRNLPYIGILKPEIYRK